MDADDDAVYTLTKKGKRDLLYCYLFPRTYLFGLRGIPGDVVLYAAAVLGLYVAISR